VGYADIFYFTPRGGIGTECGYAFSDATETPKLFIDLGTGPTLRPYANDGIALGSATVGFSDLFLASGGVINFNNGNYTITHSAGVLTVSGLVTLAGYTVAGLPAAGSNAGAIAQVTDSTVAMSGNYGATVAGGGSNRVKVFSNGTNWVIA
jgi:hypothetical protein